MRAHAIANLSVVILACLLLTRTPVIHAADGAPLTEALDFSITLQDIHSMLDERDFGSLPTDRAVILDGVAADIIVLDPEPESFLVQVDLASGRWLDLNEVRLYKAYVFFQGPGFAVRFQSGRPTEPADPDSRPDEWTRRTTISPNSRVMVLGLIVDVYEDHEGTLAPVLEGIDIRLID